MNMLWFKPLSFETFMTLMTTLSYLQRGRAGGRGRVDARTGRVDARTGRMDARTCGRCYSMPPHTAEYMS